MQAGHEDLPFGKDPDDNEIMTELRAIRVEMLAEAGGDMDGLFRAIKAEEAKLIKQGILPPPRSAPRTTSLTLHDGVEPVHPGRTV